MVVSTPTPGSSSPPLGLRRATTTTAKWEQAGTKHAVGRATVIADGGCRSTGLVIPHCRERARQTPGQFGVLAQARRRPIGVHMSGRRLN